ncbi:TraX family protein [Paenibacillus crassostreae]|uniref:Conjugal transfer protein TraX n=1 Tax=Paenibacillus crassostreae TaxID=1763538 RepID=A0A167GS41_9BACL|nr:TraX family protein [Paenibacillus crassostreae]AOZ92040.1 conjugal transfer protein TraX [Paenibacillus crassostreae]OAB77849.1 conjugal transfer protein TraX [Paenibacillus crassostreae]
MQWIAMLTMLIDHIGAVFFSDQMIWRIIGRISFPIYAYALVQGHLHTSNRLKYLVRLFIIALVSQVPYQMALNPSGLNVVVTLLVAAIALNLLDRITSKVLSIWVIVFFIILMEVFPFDYGAYGLILVLLFRYVSSHDLVYGHLILNVVYMFTNNWILQMFSIVLTMTIIYGPKLWKRVESIRVNKWIWRSFYPVHLGVIAILKWIS